jgi:hypothetical protein
VQQQATHYHSILLKVLLMSGVFKACASGVGQPPTATATATEGAARVTVVAEPSIRDGKAYVLCCFFFYLM